MKQAYHSRMQQGPYLSLAAVGLFSLVHAEGLCKRAERLRSSSITTNETSETHSSPLSLLTSVTLGRGGHLFHFRLRVSVPP